jgi:hypothetical protein
MEFKLYFEHLKVAHNKLKELQESNSDYKELITIHKLFNLHLHIPTDKNH